MSLLLPLALLASLQQPQQQPAPPIPESPIARIVVSPTTYEITTGDTVRFTAEARDAAGRKIDNAIIRFVPRGGQGEGSIDSAGTVVASSVGKMPVNVVALVPGTRPKVQPLDLRMVPGPAARVEIRTPVEKIAVGQQLRMAALPFTKVNDRARDPIRWSSSAPSVARIDADGMLTALGAGKTTLTAQAGTARATKSVEVVGGALNAVAITPAKPRARQGDVVRFKVSAKDAAGRAVTGLTPTWFVSPGNGQVDQDGAFVGYEPGDYLITANLGTKQASTVVHLEPRDVRRSVSVVGRLPRTEFPTSEVWIHPNGKVAYLGTHGGGDRVYTIDISTPSNPVIVDSIVVNTRLVNDMQTTADGNYMVLTREGAADRKNGIVIADTRDPLHPKQIADFTDGVTAGVHSVYLYENPKFGKFVYLTNDGTGTIDVIDITDPAKPKRVTDFKTNRPDPARYVHDLDIHDGLLYASYWNDGLVVLDIGNEKGGARPDKPTMVSQMKYNLDSLYSEVEAVSGAGFMRGTHTAWRQRDGHYVFIGDEVYRNAPVEGAKDASASRMYGTLQVIDVSDIEHPRSVAWYKPENGGVHNYWAVGDTLYIGAYDAGFHVFDISGELKGDLMSQGREMASLNTADMNGNTKNAAFTWGVVVNPKDGLAYVNDFNNGLWVVRLNPKKDRVVP
jgi:plastocyanin